VFRRQREGSVICTSCGVLVGVNDDRCYNCGRRNPGLWGFAPMLRSLGHDLGFVPFVIGTCVLLYALTLLASGGGVSMQAGFGFLSPNPYVLFAFGASGAVPVFAAGRWWTVLSAGWLHAGALHILFNMFVLRQMGPATADIYGPARTVIIYIVAAIAGFALSSVLTFFTPWLPFVGRGGFTVGASASIAGLIGAIFHYGRHGSSTMARQYAMQYIIAMVFYAFIFAGIDNAAHLGGFLGGYVAARMLDPMKPERVDHVVIALGLLVLSLGSVVVSIVTGLEYFR
jgi:rhomboid protease GluP